MSGWLVVNADDLGVSRGATLGVIEAHRNGIVTSASLAVTTADYRHALESCVRECPDLGIGLHFTLTSGEPVSGAKRVPLLADGGGVFRWRFMSLLRAAGVQRDRELLNQIDVELEAQLGRLARDGVRPDHIDGERHVHLIPGIFERVVAAAKRHGIAYIRLGRDAGRRVLRVSHLMAIIMNGGIAKSRLLALLTARNRRRLRGELRSPDRVASYLHSGRVDLFLPYLLHARPITGVTEVMVHPGLPWENGAPALGNETLEAYLRSDDRRRELDACVAAKSIHTEWRLTNYRQLSALETAC